MSKDSLLIEATAAHNDLITAVEPLDDATLSERAFGDWAIKHLLAHIAGWQRLNAEMIQRIARGQHPIPDGADYSDDDKMNAAFAAEADRQTPAEVIATLRESFTQLTAAATALPEERFTENRLSAQMLQGNAITHVHEHLTEIHAHLAAK